MQVEPRFEQRYARFLATPTCYTSKVCRFEGLNPFPQDSYVTVDSGIHLKRLPLKFSAYSFARFGAPESAETTNSRLRAEGLLFNTSVP